MEPGSTSRQEAKKSFWQQQIHKWQASGLTQKTFCRNQSLALSTFTYWKRKIGQPEPETVTFYPLAIPASGAQPGDSGLRLHVGEKRFSIEIKNEFSATTLKNLISVLEQL